MTANEDLAALGRAIRHHRKALGISQEELADRAGLHRNYVGLLERGERNPSYTTVCAVARALGISAPEVLVWL
ncbi:helix-turn-helix domain-containing protein [Caulobacter sp. NIBR2454]|uniref:helix-turn-helix domain-containing protein n=1 Tax=Caulobacter sp. NIBR2454 TaxID=3015996 RepID=UPI0022B61C84|nr:helix-turn-helix transcriptional regulator [Caulobacter sp. NIBR2454]